MQNEYCVKLLSNNNLLTKQKLLVYNFTITDTMTNINILKDMKYLYRNITNF